MPIPSVFIDALGDTMVISQKGTTEVFQRVSSPVTIPLRGKYRSR
jgi:hypothetical protein